MAVRKWHLNQALASYPSLKAVIGELTLEEVIAVLADKSRAGYTEQVKELLKKHGADKLSAVDPAEYKALLADAEVIGNVG